MRHVRVIALLAVTFSVLAPAQAFADATLFLGVNTSPANRTTTGFAIGAGLLIVGFEFEFANTTDDTIAKAPALKTGMGNVLLQTPFAVAGIQPYVTVGAGGYHEELGTTINNTGFATNAGGGLKISLVGPVRLRVDYRLLTPVGASTTPAHRVYAGVNLKF